MSQSPAAVLARIKVLNPSWSIRKIEGDWQGGEKPSYIAERGSTGDRIVTDNLGYLEDALHRKANGAVADG